MLEFVRTLNLRWNVFMGIGPAGPALSNYKTLFVL